MCLLTMKNLYIVADSCYDDPWDISIQVFETRSDYLLWGFEYINEETQRDIVESLMSYSDADLITVIEKVINDLLLDDTEWYVVVREHPIEGTPETDKETADIIRDAIKEYFD